MITILQYNAGNVKSVQNALNRMGVESQISNKIDDILQSDKLIIPGVGEAGSAMNYLKEKDLHTLIPTLKQPVLGICLGLQIMCSHSEEKDTECLNIFPNKVKQFPATDIVPHMGWNSLINTKGSLFDNISSTQNDMYFVHSFYAELGENTIAECAYITNFSAVLQKDNFYACQFHPEKSAGNGKQLIENFLKL